MARQCDKIAVLVGTLFNALIQSADPTWNMNIILQSRELCTMFAICYAYGFEVRNVRSL